MGETKGAIKKQARSRSSFITGRNFPGRGKKGRESSPEQFPGSNRENGREQDFGGMTRGQLGEMRWGKPLTVQNHGCANRE